MTSSEPTTVKSSSETLEVRPDPKTSTDPQSSSPTPPAHPTSHGDTGPGNAAPSAISAPLAGPEVDDFGLPIRKRPPRSPRRSSSDDGASRDDAEDGEDVEAYTEGETGRVVFRRRRRSPEPQDNERLRSRSGLSEEAPISNGEQKEHSGKLHTSGALVGKENGQNGRSRSTSSRAGSDGFVSAPASRRDS